MDILIHCGGSSDAAFICGRGFTLEHEVFASESLTRKKSFCRLQTCALAWWTMLVFVCLVDVMDELVWQQS